MEMNQLAVSSVTFRDLPLAGALEQMRAAGFTCFDLTAIRHFCDHFDPLLVDVGEEVCVRTKAIIDEHGMSVISITTYPGNPLAEGINGDDWTSGVDAYVRLALHVQPQQLIFPPGTPAPRPEHWRGTAEHAKPWLREAVRRTLNARLIPAIALQSASLVRTSEEGMAFLKILGQPETGLAIDPAHLAAIGEDPAAAIRRMGSRITFVIFRDTDGTNYNLPPGSGQLDYPAILRALDDIAYAGPRVLAIDDINLSLQERLDMLQRGRDFLAAC